MSAHQIKAGDQVVCVDDGKVLGGLLGRAFGLVKGAVYTVKRIYVDAVGHVLVDVDLERDFDISRFRPVQKRSTDISIFQAMLTKTSVDA